MLPLSFLPHGFGLFFLKSSFVVPLYHSLVVGQVVDAVRFRSDHTLMTSLFRRRILL